MLTTIGVKFHSGRALDILAEHGAAVDRRTTVAKLTPAIIEQALATRAESWTVAGRLPEFDLPFDGEHVYLSGDGCGVFRREDDGSVRPSRKQDLAEAARIIDAMPNLSATSAIVSAQDCPAESRVLHEFDACVRNSAKHTIVVSIKEDWEARSLIRMAEAMAGGMDELRAKPRFSAIICTVAPLQQERFGMDLALTLAEAGVPILFYPMPILGATAPVTIAGAAVVNNAEFLSGLALVQLAHPGARVMHGGGPTAMYMDSGAYASNSPEALLLRAVQGQMADFYSVPAWYGAGATTAKEPGVQSGYENTLAMMTAYLAGADCTFGTGLLDGSRILALEQIVTDDETFGMLTRILRGVEVADETIARDLIAEDGVLGQLPVRLAYAQTRARAVAREPERDRHLRAVAGRRRQEHRRQSARAGRRDPRRRARAPVPRRPRPRVRHDHRGGRGRGPLGRARGRTLTRRGHRLPAGPAASPRCYTGSTTTSGGMSGHAAMRLPTPPEGSAAMNQSLRTFPRRWRHVAILVAIAGVLLMRAAAPAFAADGLRVLPAPSPSPTDPLTAGLLSEWSADVSGSFVAYLQGSINPPNDWNAVALKSLDDDREPFLP